MRIYEELRKRISRKRKKEDVEDMSKTKKIPMIDSNEGLFIITACVGLVFPLALFLISPFLALIVAYLEGLFTRWILTRFFRETIKELPLLNRLLISSKTVEQKIEQKGASASA
jgi:hypothetical protein